MNAYTELAAVLNAHNMTVGNIAWARVLIEGNDDVYYDGGSTVLYTGITLQPYHTPDELQSFLAKLAGIEYDSGYGHQHLFGVVMLKSGSLFERHAYDGAEGWHLHTVPTIGDDYLTEVKNDHEVLINEI